MLLLRLLSPLSSIIYCWGCPAVVLTSFFPREEHRYPSPLPFLGMGPSDAAANPLGGALFAEDVRTHIPRAWAVDDDEDYADSEVRQWGWLNLLVAAEARAVRVVDFCRCCWWWCCVYF